MFCLVGKWLPENKEVAIKFMPLTEKKNAEHDYDVYAQLRAINNSNVERFGIANVYYFAQWEGYYVMAMTLLDSYLDEKMAGHAMNKMDILLFAKQFVSKIPQHFDVHFFKKKIYFFYSQRFKGQIVKIRA